MSELQTNLNTLVNEMGAHRLGTALVETVFYALESHEKNSCDLSILSDTLALAMGLLTQE